MNPLLTAAAEVQSFCERQGWPSCLIGGVAVARWSEPRTTRDVDMSVLTGFGQESAFIGALLSHFAPRIPDAGRFAETSRVLLLTASNGIAVDVALAGLPFEERMIRRSSSYEYFPGTSLRTVSAEDLIVLKAFAGRTQDWADIEAILRRQKKCLDRKLIFDELAPLCELKEDDTAVEHLRKLLDAQSS
jgi:hypothetical protein